MAESAAKGLIKTILPERNSFNYVKLDMATATLKELGDELSFLPLGEEKKVVVATNFFYLNKSRSELKPKKGDDDSEFFRYVKDPDPSIDLFILVLDNAIDASKNNKYYDALLKANAKMKEVTPLSPQDWLRRLETAFAKRGIEIETKALYELNNRIQGDYSAFLSETQKLFAYSNGNKITKDDVEKLVTKPLEDDNFALSKALIKGDISKALSIYKDFKIAGYEPITLARGLANQFRFLNQVSFLSKQGYEKEKIASILLSKPIRVEIALSNLDKMHIDTCQKALESLYEYEYGVLSGKMDPDIGFSLFLSTFEL